MKCEALELTVIPVYDQTVFHMIMMTNLKVLSKYLLPKLQNGHPLADGHNCAD